MNKSLLFHLHTLQLYQHTILWWHLYSTPLPVYRVSKQGFQKTTVTVGRDSKLVAIWRHFDIVPFRSISLEDRQQKLCFPRAENDDSLRLLSTVSRVV